MKLLSNPTLTGWRWYTIRLSRAARSRHTSSVLSVEALSQITSSRFPWSWLSTDSTTRSSPSAPLRTGNPTETRVLVWRIRSPGPNVRGQPSSSDTLEPDLPPEWHELARAVSVASAATDDVVQNDAGILHRQHPAGFLIDALRHACLDTRRAATMKRHFLFEAHTSVQSVFVEGRLYLLLGLDADHFAGLQIEMRRRCRTDDSAPDKAPRQAVAEPQLRR